MLDLSASTTKEAIELSITNLILPHLYRQFAAHCIAEADRNRKMRGRSRYLEDYAPTTVP